MHILTNVTTEDARRKLDTLARQSGYRITQWLEPRDHGGGLKVICEMAVDNKPHTRGFVWDGNDINHLAVLCMALNVSMQGLPEYVRSMSKIRKH